MPKEFVTLLQGKQQLCKHLLFESLVGQCEYTTQAKGSFCVILLIQRVQYY